MYNKILPYVVLLHHFGDGTEEVDHLTTSFFVNRFHRVEENFDQLFSTTSINHPHLKMDMTKRRLKRDLIISESMAKHLSI